MLVFVVILLAVLFLLILFMRDIGFWINARLSKAPISFTQIISLRFSNVPTDEILGSVITLNKIGIEISVARLLEHSDSGGDVKKVTKALVMARQNNVDLSFEDAADKDLKGKDVIAEVNTQIDKK